MVRQQYRILSPSAEIPDCIPHSGFLVVGPAETGARRRTTCQVAMPHCRPAVRAIMFRESHPEVRLLQSGHPQGYHGFSPRTPLHEALSVSPTTAERHPRSKRRGKAIGSPPRGAWGAAYHGV